ncbi:hypothetical protein UA08_04425 [Talaromyces atroroseus]|uniref:Uncharacterized protein n=1 Tax=Talaromyces atroroseus TaxID=1441469 RepID=A0A1Q5Q8J8_TALAT|nr:hypothetical protein UA08_04425 [Talaromyces atroroseus]OKL60456.1 hypothetical protein UA08_04425 [Talaromyces atroroseus]
MEEKSKSSSFYILNAGALLLILSVVGSTFRFMVISATLVSWLQTQWLRYTSLLKKRRSARLAAAADEARTRHRTQVADISESIGENVISLLDQRRERALKLSQERERKRHDHEQVVMKRVMEHLIAFQESQERERINKDQQLKAREDNILARERKSKQAEEALQALQKKLEEREQRLKAAEDSSARKIHLQQEEFRTQAIQPAVVAFNPTPVKFTLPSDLLEYAGDLELYFTCIGVTKKGTRCRQSMISNADKSAAAGRIARMKSSNCEAALFELNALRELADWMLCPLWHRYKLPQGPEIASRWYFELSDARARLKSQANALTPNKGFGAASTPSTGVASVFSSSNTSSTGTAASVQSVSYTGSGFQSMSPPGAGQLFQKPAARNLTPMFEAMARQPR